MITIIHPQGPEAPNVSTVAESAVDAVMFEGIQALGIGLGFRDSSRFTSGA